MHPSSRLDEAQMSRKNQIIFLIGPMGSGKTTLGRRVADSLGLDFFDCDRELEKLTGASVNLIFDIEGEAGFRERETRILEEMASRESALISTGGGVVTRKVNRDILRRHGYIVWLKTPVAQQLHRLGRDRVRPLLQTPNREQRLRELARERDPLYSELADLVFETRNRNVRLVASELAQAIREQWIAVEDG
jgi:shikimate kinase